MLDLDKLERKLDEALEKETLESLRKWLNEKRKVLDKMEESIKNSKL